MTRQAVAVMREWDRSRCPTKNRRISRRSIYGNSALSTGVGETSAEQHQYFAAITTKKASEKLQCWQSLSIRKQSFAAKRRKHFLSRHLRRFPVVMIQQASQARLALNLTFCANRERHDRSVSQRLVRTFMMIMGEVFAEILYSPAPCVLRSV